MLTFENLRITFVSSSTEVPYHHPIGFLPLCFSLSAETVTSVTRAASTSASAESLNDILDNLSEAADGDDGGTEKPGEACSKVCH